MNQPYQKSINNLSPYEVSALPILHKNLGQVMFNFFKKKQKNDLASNNNERSLVLSDDKLIPFEVYQVRILYPQSWSVFIIPNQEFTFSNGTVKIDHSLEGKLEKISLSLRWVQVDKDLNIDEYMEKLINQFGRKQSKNKKDKYVINAVEDIEGMQHKAKLLTSTITANHSVYRKFGKDETFRTFQINTICPETNRLVIASVTSDEETFEQKKDFFYTILKSLRCH